MAVLYRAVHLLEDLKKEAMIEELLKMGVIKRPVSLKGLSYDEVKRLLLSAKIRTED